MGVSFFFILSGFVLAWSTPTTMRPAEFFRRRIARIYPAMLVVLLVSIVVPVVAVGRSLVSLLASVLLVQAWSPSVPVIYGMNGVAWSLSCEIAFYAAFPFVLRLLQGRASRDAG